MPRDEKRRQNSLAHKAAKRKQKKHALVAQASPTSGRAQLRAAAHWPLYECLVSQNWDQPGELVQVLVSRRAADGEIGAALFLVDLGCLGVKDVVTHVFPFRSEYEEFRNRMTSYRAWKKADLNLAAKIIREGIAYARSLGFSPQRDYAEAALMIGDADPDACRTQIPLGIDGKPYYVSGPFDNVPKIVRQLDKIAGPGNYHYILGIGAASEILEELGE